MKLLRIKADGSLIEVDYVERKKPPLKKVKNKTKEVKSCQKRRSQLRKR